MCTELYFELNVYEPDKDTVVHVIRGDTWTDLLVEICDKMDQDGMYELAHRILNHVREHLKCEVACTKERMVKAEVVYNRLGKSG